MTKQPMKWNSKGIIQKITDGKLKAEWGTFKDSLKAPIHSWFTYPAGFSYKAVEHSLKIAGMIPGKSIIYDPFAWSWTTNIVAKSLGYHSIGVEANPFVHNIALAKMHWELNNKEVTDFLTSIDKIIGAIPNESEIQKINSESFPELILKCYLPESLYKLKCIRDSIKKKGGSKETKRFLETALICTLREVSIAATGWPYIAPKKIKITSMSKCADQAFVKKALKMLNDANIARNYINEVPTHHEIILGDSRSTKISSESIDHLFTSPPYLNNFDYADRVRLEMYFMGEAWNWGDLSKKIRTKLMTSATTQISRNDKRYDINPAIKESSPEIFDFLVKSKEQLSELRKIKGGKKSYDLLVSWYFNDMYDILRDNFRILKPWSKAIYILGDSAPYGIHIPTDELIGKLWVSIGFKTYGIEVLRERWGKWASNPQRHSVSLRETIVTLIK